MSVKILEEICSEADLRISTNPGQSVDISMNPEQSIDAILKKVGIDQILKESSGTDEMTVKYYKEFARVYTKLTRDYLKKREEARPEINWQRVIKNGAIFAAISLLYEPNYEFTNPYVVAAGALAGANITLYDETKHKGIDLLYIGLGAFVGAFAGIIFGSTRGNDPIKYVTGLIGIATGFGLALRNAKGNAAEEKYRLQRQLDDSYKRDRKELIQFYRLLVSEVK